MYLLAGILVAGAGAGFIGYLIVRYDYLHKKWSHDPSGTGPQKFHLTPTPRIGGLCLIAGFLLARTVLFPNGESSGSGMHFATLLLVALPVLLAGILEDFTKKTGVMTRLIASMLSAALGAWLLGAVIPRLGLPGVDALLEWTPLAIAFTVFAVSGVTHSINIIDGYNGLASGIGIIALAAFAYVSHLLGDQYLLSHSLVLMGALIGFMLWNYPGGKIFLGDGGAYFLGFMLAELSVLLVARHPEVSPWFPMLLLAYPVTEALYSIYRRKILKGLSPGAPDRDHLHQLIYLRLAENSPKTDTRALSNRLNNQVAPHIWLVALCFTLMAAMLWQDTLWLIAVTLMFVFGYCLLYRKYKQPEAESAPTEELAKNPKAA